MWNLHSIASEYGRLPSEVIGLPAHSWQAYNLDLCCVQFGRWVESKLREVDKQGKPRNTLAGLLAGDEQKPQSEFRGMSGLAMRKVAIPESGIW